MPSVTTAPRDPGLISTPRRAEHGLPHFAFVPTHARHHCALPLSAIKAPLVPAAFIRRPTPMLPPQAPAPPRVARRPHHRRPQPLPRAPIARFPPPPFLHEFIDNRPLRPSPGTIPASASTTLPRITSTPFQLPISPASPSPHRCSPTPPAITVASQALVSPLPIRPPNRLPLAFRKDTGPTFPSSPPSAGTAIGAARCSSLLEGLRSLEIAAMDEAWWTQGFTWFGPPECNTLRPWVESLY
jgi:hypothetical protein